MLQRLRAPVPQPGPRPATGAWGPRTSEGPSHPSSPASPGAEALAPGHVTSVSIPFPSKSPGRTWKHVLGYK